RAPAERSARSSKCGRSSSWRRTNFCPHRSMIERRSRPRSPGRAPRSSSSMGRARWSARATPSPSASSERLKLTAMLDSPRTHSPPRLAEASLADLDPITVEVIRRRLVSIADEVDVNITRTAFSPYIYEYKDYAVGIVDAGGDLICQCTAGMPVFVADVMRAAIQDGLDIYGADDLNEGDVIINNDAGVIGQHLNNMAMYTPIHAPDAGGQSTLIGFMVVVMHWIDVGGRDVGSTSKFATDIFQEG